MISVSRDQTAGMVASQAIWLHCLHFSHPQAPVPLPGRGHLWTQSPQDSLLSCIPLSWAFTSTHFVLPSYQGRSSLVSVLSPYLSSPASSPHCQCNPQAPLPPAWEPPSPRLRVFYSRPVRSSPPGLFPLAGFSHLSHGGKAA